MSKLAKCTIGLLVAFAVTMSTANAQNTITFPNPPPNPDPFAANAAFPPQNPLGPTGTNYQVTYPYPGQCRAANPALFPTLSVCSATASSFGCNTLGGANRTAGGWAKCGTVTPFFEVAPVLANSVAPKGAVGFVATPKFGWEVLNPPAYTPDPSKYPGADYYEIGVHEAWGFQALATLGAFPNPRLVGLCSASGARCDPAVLPPAACGTCAAAPDVPNGMQWTGLLCNVAAGCSCPADAEDVSTAFGGKSFKAAYCSSPTGKVPYGAPLYTPIWGVGQINMGGTLGNSLPPTPSPWSQNTYLASWPSISIRANRGTPVVVKWVNEFPNSHVLCPHPDVADWPCAIDRTFMGVKPRIDPAAMQGMDASAAAQGIKVSAEGVNIFGSPQQPDNSWVTHLHGGEVPPSTDGFAQLWFGNLVTAPIYNDDGTGPGKLVNPPFENPSGLELRRPTTNFATYTYPMIQEEATIWFHDHTLGKTHHNVIAGPAGFFPVKEPLKHGGVSNGVASGVCPPGYTGCSTDYTWLDPVTEPGKPGAATYDLFLAIQDRSFNDDGSINFSNGLGNTVPQPPLVPGTTSITPGVNPQVHPTWVPEYFGDHVLVNGVLWPKKSTEPGWYRIRLVDGSDSRCWTIGFQLSALPPAPGTGPLYNVPFWVLATDQGYNERPVAAPANQFTMCPGERYELLVNFGALPGLAPGAAASVFMVNNAPAPFPAGISPIGNKSLYKEMNVIMKFDVNSSFGPGVKSCGNGAPTPASLTWDPTATNDANGNLAVDTATGKYTKICMPPNPGTVLIPGYNNIRPTWPLPVPAPAGTIVRQLYLNERVDGITAAPFGMQLNGVPFEYKVTETPKLGTKEIWQFINLTVDAHPMHPHLVKNQIVARQPFSVGGYKKLLCGSTSCQPGPVPGGEMQVVPDPTPLLGLGLVLVTPASVEGGFKDVVQAPPGMVTTIVAEWTARWNGAKSTGTPDAPGTSCSGIPCAVGGTPASWTYEPVWSGPYVWHCHINSHEDSEMMRTSLVVQ